MKIIIVGAGPAGLTAAYELTKSGYKPEIFERDNIVGGISRTVEYKGNHIDIGGHRFFSKSDVVMEWWNNILPTESEVQNPDKIDRIMLKRNRLSRILWMRKLFNYPLSFTPETFFKLGIFRAFAMGLSYIKAMAFPVKPEKNLQDFFINRFGKKLYLRFFKDYTEKVWGVPCSSIDASWGAQRVKGLSILKAIAHALKFKDKAKDKDINQKDTETSLIERFLYPKFGPGLMWETVAASLENSGVKIRMKTEIVSVNFKGRNIVSISAKGENGVVEDIPCDVLISSMPIKDLLDSFKGIEIPEDVLDTSRGLMYRDFITVGLLCDKILLKSCESESGLIKDNWIYIQESEVKVGRLQIFNNWSPYMVSDKSKVWIGLEYFCNEGDELWSMPDSDFLRLAKEEMQRCAIVNPKDVSDGIVIRIKKAYPAYFGKYKDFPKVRNFLDTIENLYCVGRNGQHRYNNMDHSMLSAMEAVKNITGAVKGKENIWSVNSEETYHESK